MPETASPLQTRSTNLDLVEPRQYARMSVPLIL